MDTDTAQRNCICVSAWKTRAGLGLAQLHFPLLGLAFRFRFRFRFSLLDFVSFWIAGKSGAVIVDLPVVAQAHSRFLHTDFQHSSVLHVAQAEKHFPLAAVHFT